MTRPAMFGWQIVSSWIGGIKCYNFTYNQHHGRGNNNTVRKTRPELYDAIFVFLIARRRDETTFILSEIKICADDENICIIIGDELIDISESLSIMPPLPLLRDQNN